MTSSRRPLFCSQLEPESGPQRRRKKRSAGINFLGPLARLPWQPSVRSGSGSGSGRYWSVTGKLDRRIWLQESVQAQNLPASVRELGEDEGLVFRQDRGGKTTEKIKHPSELWRKRKEKLILCDINSRAASVEYQRVVARTRSRFCLQRLSSSQQ